MPLGGMSDNNEHPEPASESADAVGVAPDQGQNLPAVPGRIDEVAAARWRRVVHRLHDIGLLGAVGPDWVRVVDGRFEFGDLEGKAAEEFLRVLDLLVDQVEPNLDPFPWPFTPEGMFEVSAGEQLALPLEGINLNHARHHLAVTR